MSSWTPRICLVTLASVFYGITFPGAAHGLPLQEGLYRMGSTYIRVVTKDQRLCFHGFSSRGSTVASITPDPELEGFYRISGFGDRVLHQQDIRTLLFGSVNSLSTYEADYNFPRNIDSTLQECLDSHDAFFQRTNSTR